MPKSNVNNLNHHHQRNKLSTRLLRQRLPINIASSCPHYLSHMQPVRLVVHPRLLRRQPAHHHKVCTRGAALSNPNELSIKYLFFNTLDTILFLYVFAHGIINPFFCDACMVFISLIRYLVDNTCQETTLFSSNSRITCQPRMSTRNTAIRQLHHS